MIKKAALVSLYPDEKFLLSRAMRFIADKFDFPDNAIADFSDTLFVLPTAEAGRLFREKAAVFFKDRGGVMQLQTILPEQLLFNSSDINCNEVNTLNAWFEVLKNSSCGSAAILKPDIEYTNEALFSLADICARTRENIRMESSLNTETLLTGIDDPMLKEKISDFKKLEDKYLEIICPLIDKASTIEQTLANPMKNLQGIKQIILIECVELKNSIAAMLEKISGNMDITFCLNITVDEWNLYDKACRPLTDLIIQKGYDFCPEERFRAYPSPLQEAMKIASLLQKDELPDSIGVLDSDLVNPLTHILAEKDIEVYTPRKQPLSSFYWYKLFNMLIELCSRSLPFEKVYEWASDDSFAAYADFDSVKVRIIAEKLQREHLIQDFDALKFFCSRNSKNLSNESEAENYTQCMKFCSALDKLRSELQSVNTESFPVGIWPVFSSIAQCNTLENMDINQAEASLETLKKIISDIRRLPDRQSNYALFKHLAGNSTVKDADPFRDDAVSFSGFLDLIWYENNSLIISGMTEKAFNTSTQEDMFFPEHIRRKLNWSSAWSHFGADIHRFSILNDQYGDTELFISSSNTDAEGKLNTPPRLFFAVNNCMLLDHCDLFFHSKLTESMIKGEDDEQEILKYAPHTKENIQDKISVTAFEKYIACPYTFYLTNILYCEEPGSEIIELQPNQSGNIIHAVLEEYGKKFSTEIPDEDTLRKFAEIEFEKKFRIQTGYSVNNIALMQGAELKRALNAFIDRELEYRKKFSKHQILHSEFKLDVTFAELRSRLPEEWLQDMPEMPEELRNIHISGKIDRIDLNIDSEGRQSCCIIDYKTAKTPESPEQAHISNRNAAHLNSDIMDISRNSSSGKYFCNMQLIIYKLMAQFMRDAMNIPEDIPVRCGYFNLPEDVSKTALEFFDALDDDTLRKGALVLQYLLTKIFVEKKFWPPALNSEYTLVKNYFAGCTENDFETEGNCNG